MGNHPQATQEVRKTDADNILAEGLYDLLKISRFSVFPCGSLPCILIYRSEIGSDVFSKVTFH